jgi:hypothetical protein
MTDHSAKRQPPARTSWARLAILRLFALSPSTTWSQSNIARRIGLTQVAVHKQLPTLGDLVEAGPTGWRSIDRAACWDRFIDDYPGPRGLVTYWTAAAGDLAAQLARIERAMKDTGQEAAAVSGDFAADFYAPWRQPSRIVAYIATQPSLENHGFAMVRVADATIELRIAKDPTIAAMSRAWSTVEGGRRYVDPLIAAWDLSRTRGGDVESAVEHLRERSLREPIWS